MRRGGSRDVPASLRAYFGFVGPTERRMTCFGLNGYNKVMRLRCNLTQGTDVRVGAAQDAGRDDIGTGNVGNIS